MQDPATVRADADGGVLAAQRRLAVGPAWTEVPPVAFRAPIGPTDHPLGPFAAISADGSRLLVSASFAASDLGTVAVHRGVTSSVVLGRLQPEALLTLPPHEVVAWLVAIGRLELFAHLEGHATLVAEARTPEGAWRGVYQGSHVYFTNARHEPTFAFAVQLGPDGVVAVSPP
ncbi:MAG: hypothetical protein RLZZ383_2882 [Pseudomonadota bacterium]|jgi:hypothetical protein